MEDTILTSILSAACTGGLFYFIFQRWIENEFSQKLEKLKDQLRRETEVSISQASFRYSKVFERTEEAIATVYENLIKLEGLVQQYRAWGISMTSDKNTEFHDVLQKQYMEFVNHFSTKKIYIPKETAKKVFNFAQALLDSQMYHRTAIMMQQSRVDPELVAKKFEEFDQKFKQLPALLEALEDEFQRLLGFQETIIPKS